MAVAEGLEPSMTGLTVRRLTNLATPQDLFSHKEAEKAQNKTRTKTPFLTIPLCALCAFCGNYFWWLDAATRLELVSTRLQDERSGSIELRRKNLVDREGLKPSQEVCRTSMLSFTSPARKFGGCGWSRTTSLALMRRLLFPFELHSR